eukprot:10189.XXX_320790_322863_1 [CDS] Oithona nana genome sequencing.
MAAILRSGKFLRIVSNLARSTQGGQQQQQGQQTQQCPATFPTQDAQPYHAWSLQHLQNALPILSTDQDKAEVKRQDEEQHQKLQRRGSDPLLEFYVDKQKIEEAAKKFIEPSRIGLNVVQDLNEDKQIECIDNLKVKQNNDRTENLATANNEEKTEKDRIEEICYSDLVVENKEELKEPVVHAKAVESHKSEKDESATEGVDPELEKEVLLPTTLAETETAATLVPLCEDPVSQQWFPLPVVCQMFRDQGRIYDLEALLWGSYGIAVEDRKCIYYWTLQAYADAGMFPQAVDLTRRLETERLEFPEYHTLMNNFAMAIYAQQHQQKSTPTPPNVEQSHRKLKKAIATKDLNACLENYRGQDLNVTEASSLIEMFVKEDMLSEAMEVTERMLSKESYPLPRIFRFLLNRLAAKGQVEAMCIIGTYLTPKIKKEVSFDNRLCNAFLSAGRAADYLHLLILELEEALNSNDLDDEKLQVLKDKFPRGGAMGLLESDPNLIEPYTRLALKFVDLGYIAPVNVLWTYHFINGRHDLALPLWNKYVKTCPQIMFQKVCQTARATSNQDLAERLVHLLENAAVTNGARGIAYSCLLDVLTQNEDYIKGVESLEQGLKSGIKLEDFNRTALKRLKECLEKEDVDFPYDIPKKSADDS